MDVMLVVGAIVVGALDTIVAVVVSIRQLRRFSRLGDSESGFGQLSIPLRGSDAATDEAYVR